MIFIFCFQYNYRDTQAKVTKVKDAISEKTHLPLPADTNV